MNFSIGLGIMSGTSLDGLDLAICKFGEQEGHYTYDILATKEIPFTEKFKHRLSEAPTVSAIELSILDHDFADFCAEQVKKWISEIEITPDFIASHGHTIFHDPVYGYTTQIGNGGLIAGKTGITTVSDFRTLDLALEGQGAPLVPLGDHYLFSEFEACLNLGGIANISYLKDNQRVAYDISLCNIPLNFWASQNGVPYDKNGDFARSGVPNQELLHLWNQLPYYRKDGPKSLGREWFEAEFLPLTDSFQLCTNDLLATALEHIAIQIAAKLPMNGTVLVTGGGAFNTYLIEKITTKSHLKPVLPENRLICFKEAIVFAFLGYLRMNQKINTLSEVTGAKQHSCGGAIYFIN